MVTFQGDIPMSRVKKFLDWWYGTRNTEIMDKVRNVQMDNSDIRKDPTLSPQEKHQKIQERIKEYVQRQSQKLEEDFKNLSQEQKDNIFRTKR